jgi:hypothetical protein
VSVTPQELLDLRTGLAVAVTFQGEDVVQDEVSCKGP